MNDSKANADDRPLAHRYIIAWGLALIFYFLEYAARSAPAVMIPQLSQAFGTTAVGASTIIGTYYYTYSVANLVAGVVLDRSGGKWVIPIGSFLLGAGCLAFAFSSASMGYTGRLLQGAGSACAFTGAVYLATHGFSPRTLATAIGVTQCLGMFGGWVGQSLVGTYIQRGEHWQIVWQALAVASLVVGVALFFTTPARQKSEAPADPGKKPSLLDPYRTVFGNYRSYLCGLVAGLLFVPTTVGDMVWGVAFFQRDLNFAFPRAVSIASMIPLGWVIGCPLLGWLADRLGRRKPVLLAGAALMALVGAQLAFLPSLLPAQWSCLLFGVFSGAAMIPYTIIKEVNPDEVKGSATGAINFLTFAVTAGIGPLFAHVVGKKFDAGDHFAHFQSSAVFWLVCIAAAIGMSFLLPETGPAAKKPPASA